MNLNFDIDMSMAAWCDKIVDILDDDELSTFFNHLFASILIHRGDRVLEKSIKHMAIIDWYEKNKTVLTKEI